MTVNPRLSELTTVQTAFDRNNFSGADTPEGKRRHVLLHLGKLIGKFAAVEEQIDHGCTDTTILKNEVIPDLLVFAAQLAEIEHVQLDEAYVGRLFTVAERNGTGKETAARAIRSVE